MILDHYTQFLDKLHSHINAKGIDISGFYLDHIGYQCSSDEDYDKLKPELLSIGKMVSENFVGERRVGIFELSNPLQYKGKDISAVELIAPKKDQKCPSALEHAEFVINTDLDSFVKKYPDLNWDLSAINQPVFPMAKLKLTDYTQAKFHLEPVLEIVKKEKTAPLKFFLQIKEKINDHK